MRVLVLVKATAESERGIAAMPDAAGSMAAMGRFNEALRAAGILRMAEGLQPTAAATRIAFDGAGRTVVDGPFLPAGDQVAGFWLWEVADMAEAIAWVERCPNPMPGPSEIEIRPLHDLADLPDRRRMTDGRARCLPSYKPSSDDLPMEGVQWPR